MHPKRLQSIQGSQCKPLLSWKSSARGTRNAVAIADQQPEPTLSFGSGRTSYITFLPLPIGPLAAPGAGAHAGRQVSVLPRQQRSVEAAEEAAHQLRQAVPVLAGWVIPGAALKDLHRNADEGALRIAEKPIC